MLHFKLIAETRDKVSRIGSLKQVQDKVAELAIRFNSDYDRLYQIVPYEATCCGIELLAMSKRKISKNEFLRLLEGFISCVSEELSIAKCYRISAFQAKSIGELAVKNGFLRPAPAPMAFEDCQKLADQLIEGKSVTIDFDDVDPDAAEKILGFMSGVAYMQCGNVEKLDEDKFIFLPSDTCISDMFSKRKNSGADSNGANRSSSASERIYSLVGLEEPKRKIFDRIALFEFEQENGIAYSEISLPKWVFVGNPGVGKTMLAREAYELFREKGILTGEFVECSRADIVGRYQGLTAPLVKRYFEQADKGLIFIDDFHLLLEDKRGGYGDECLGQILLEMENRRKDVMVVFATYSSELENISLVNPGFLSRLTAVIYFDDYSTDELWRMLVQMCIERNLIIEQKVGEILIPQFKKASEYLEFGGGRYVRTLFEHALTKHAARVMAMPEDSVSRKVKETLTVVDFI